ncbi:MAG: methyltransferase domain-containing protein [Candidatus Eisenbacteria bacterium]|nr:methyltransferase domain-containing protein [Candidatus Eisenbacteria bacterium]
MSDLYRHPEHYDIAFTWDLGPEIEFFGRVFAEHVPFPVRRILEPCCGTGRFLLELPRHGYSVTGYDRSPEMLEYARRRVADLGDPVAARAVGGDMVTALFDREFDAALNSINSIGYLLSDEEIVAHLRNTGASLVKGGVYIVHIACEWEGEPDLGQNTWTMERDGLSVTTTWRIESEDRDARLSQQVCTMEIDDHGKKSSHTFRETLRLWRHYDLKELVSRSQALEYAALYSESFERLPPGTRATGEMGNLYHVLRAV